MNTRCITVAVLTLFVSACSPESVTVNEADFGDDGGSTGFSLLMTEFVGMPDMPEEQPEPEPSGLCCECASLNSDQWECVPSVNGCSIGWTECTAIDGVVVSCDGACNEPAGMCCDCVAPLTGGPGCWPSHEATCHPLWWWCESGTLEECFDMFCGEG